MIVLKTVYQKLDGYFYRFDDESICVCVPVDMRLI